MPAIQEPSEMAEGQEEAEAVEVEDVMVKQSLLYAVTPTNLAPVSTQTVMNRQH